MSKRPPNPLSLSMGTFPQSSELQRKQRQQEEMYNEYQKLLKKATDGYMLISDYEVNGRQIPNETNIYDLDDNFNMKYKGYYDQQLTKQIRQSMIQRKTSHGHIINRTDYVKMEGEIPEKVTYADLDMYGGKSRKNKRTNKRKSRKIRKSRKNRK